MKQFTLENSLDLTNISLRINIGLFPNSDYVQSPFLTVGLTVGFIFLPTGLPTGFNLGG
jgi:hypothetical protein